MVPAAHLPTNNMSKAYYLPADDDGKGSWLDNLSVKLPSYQLALGLTPEDVTSLAADAAYFAFALKAQTRVSTYSQQWTAYKNAARNGTGTTLGLMPVAPNLGTPPRASGPGHHRSGDRAGGPHQSCDRLYRIYRASAANNRPGTSH